MEVEVETAVAAVAARHLQLHKVGEDGLDPRLRAVDREDAHRVARDDVAVRHLPLQVERHRGARAAGVRAQAPDNPKVAREVERRVGGLEQQHVAPHLRRERERQRRRRRRLRLRLRFGLLPVCRAALALAFALERDGRARLRGEVARQRRLLRRVLGDPLGLGGVVVGHRCCCEGNLRAACGRRLSISRRVGARLLRGNCALLAADDFAASRRDASRRRSPELADRDRGSSTCSRPSASTA